MDGVYWLAEQGLAPKRVLLVIFPLFFLYFIAVLKMIFKEEMRMNNRFNTIDALNVPLDTFCGFCGDLASGALLANTPCRLSV